MPMREIDGTYSLARHEESFQIWMADARRFIVAVCRYRRAYGVVEDAVRHAAAMLRIYNVSLSG